MEPCEWLINNDKYRYAGINLSMPRAVLNVSPAIERSVGKNLRYCLRGSKVKS